VLLLAGAGATLWLGLRAWRRRDRRMAGFATMTLVAVLANAAVSGALSAPHHRYQARIAWLLLLPPLLGLTPRAAFPHPPATCAPASRSR
jgi:hypothetical protein